MSIQPLQLLPLCVVASDSTTPHQLPRQTDREAYPNPEVMGRSIKYTEGSISSLSGLHDNQQLYQLSVPLQPGNSGGPVFSNNGSVIGVARSRLETAHVESVTAREAQNVNYAIKASVLRDFLNKHNVELQLEQSNLNCSKSEIVKHVQPAVVLLMIK